MDLVLRPVAEHDLPSVSTIVTAAFRSPESRLADLQRVWALRPQVWLLALADNEPVGTVVAVDYGPFAYVGDMTVLPQRQHQGIGARLMDELLSLLDARGTPRVLLDASEAGAPLYARLGFVELDRVCLFQQVGKSDAPFTSARVDRLHPEEVDALAAWDAAYFGANRSRVFQQLVREFPGRAWVGRDERGNWSGYIFAQTRRLGPWVARRPQDAKALLQAALSSPNDYPWQVIIPQMNSAGIELLKQSGFQFAGTNNRHMERGTQVPDRRRDSIYGQASFGLG